MRGNVDKPLFVKHDNNELFVAQIYVNEIVFGSINEKKVKDFVHVMSSEFEMSMVGESNYFLGLQVKKMNDGIFVCQSKYATDLVKKFGLENAKHYNTPMSTSLKLSRDEDGKDVNPSLFRSMIGSFVKPQKSTSSVSLIK